MSSLSFHEEQLLEEVFQMGGGYVLNFNDRTFKEFFEGIVNINIEDQKYGQESKAKRLRKFWKCESDEVVGKVLKEMLVVLDNKKNLIQNKDNYNKANEIISRLIGDEKYSNEKKDFLKEDFSKIDLSSLNLESSLKLILENRLKEIRICLESKAFLATVILAGSMLEGLLLNTATNNPQKFNQANSSPKDKKTKHVLKFGD
jgi:hypothetical protein